MPDSVPSALITNKGERILIRIDGEIYELNQDELRVVLGLPAGSAGLGISIEKDRLSFEFADGETIELSARQLKRKLTKQTAAQ